MSLYGPDDWIAGWRIEGRLVTRYELQEARRRCGHTAGRILVAIGRRVGEACRRCGDIVSIDIEERLR